MASVGLPRKGKPIYKRSFLGVQLNKFASNLYQLKMLLYTSSLDLGLRTFSDSKTLLLSKCVLMLFTCIRALAAMLATLVKRPDIFDNAFRNIEEYRI